ncbi:hypothetical protein GNF98_22295, partial [Clostridium perfringens]
MYSGWAVEVGRWFCADRWLELGCEKVWRGRGVLALTYDRNLASRLFNAVNMTLLVLIAAMMIIPFLYIILISFATEEEVLAKSFLLFPTKFSLTGYRYILSTPILLRSLGVTIGVT